MKKEGFLLMKEGLQKKVWPWKIETEEEWFSDFVIGCFFDSKSNLWKVYMNHERGRHRIMLETKNEDAAFEKLLDLIWFEIRSAR